MECPSSVVGNFIVPKSACGNFPTEISTISGQEVPRPTVGPTNIVASPPSGISTAGTTATANTSVITVTKGYLDTILVAQGQTPNSACPTVFTLATPIPICQQYAYVPSSVISTTGPSTKGSTTTSAAPPTPKPVTKTNTGAIAGAAIGGLAAGALLGFGLFLLFGRRKRKTSASASAEHTLYKDDSKKVPIVTKLVPDGSAAAVVENNLPQPTEDSTLAGDFQKINDRISGHIQSYYNLNASVDKLAVAQAIGQATGSRLSTAQLTQSLSTPLGRSAVLRHAIAAVIIPRLSVHCDGSETFLPSVLALGQTTRMRPDDSGK
jgi:hypothetical protein